MITIKPVYKTISNSGIDTLLVQQIGESHACHVVATGAFHQRIQIEPSLQILDAQLDSAIFKLELQVLLGPVFTQGILQWRLVKVSMQNLTRQLFAA